MRTAADKATTRRIERQARLVATLRQRLAFELLLLRLLQDRSRPAATPRAALTLQDIRLRAVDRQARQAVRQAGSVSGEVLARGVE